MAWKWKDQARSVQAPPHPPGSVGIGVGEMAQEAMGNFLMMLLRRESDKAVSAGVAALRLEGGQ